MSLLFFSLKSIIISTRLNFLGGYKVLGEPSTWVTGLQFCNAGLYADIFPNKHMCS